MIRATHHRVALFVSCPSWADVFSCGAMLPCGTHSPHDVSLRIRLPSVVEMSIDDTQLDWIRHRATLDAGGSESHFVNQGDRCCISRTAGRGWLDLTHRQQQHLVPVGVLLHPIGILFQTCHTVVVHLDDEVVDIATAREAVGILGERSIEGVLVVVVFNLLEEGLQTVFLYQQHLLGRIERILGKRLQVVDTGEGYGDGEQ